MFHYRMYFKQQTGRNQKSSRKKICFVSFDAENDEEALAFVKKHETDKTIVIDSLAEVINISWQQDRFRKIDLHPVKDQTVFEIVEPNDQGRDAWGRLKSRHIHLVSSDQQRHFFPSDDDFAGGRFCGH